MRELGVIYRHGQPTAFVIREADPATEMRAEDAVLFNQIRDARLPLVGPPAGHGHHEEANRGDIHDRGSLHHTRNLEPETASAETWDTTGLVEDQEVWTPKERPRNRQPLLLAARDFDAAFADQRVKTSVRSGEQVVAGSFPHPSTPQLSRHRRTLPLTPVGVPRTYFG
jgi:hypothetical protein